MKQFLIALPILFLLLFSPSVWAKSKGTEKDHGSHANNNSVRFEVKIKVEGQAIPNSTPSATPLCDPNANWKNHGAYVSCVARLEPGPHRLGGPGNSLAAKSSVGKQPSATSSAEATPEATSPDATSSPSATASSNIQVKINASGPIDQVIAFIEQILIFLKSLI